MGHKVPLTIATALHQIQNRQLILPAIQREYVWKPSQVIRVFDSVMRGYPIGSFLSWKVLPETVNKFRFYGFMKDYNAFDNRHNPVIDIPADREVMRHPRRSAATNLPQHRPSWHLCIQKPWRLGEQAVVLPRAPPSRKPGRRSTGERTWP